MFEDLLNDRVDIVKPDGRSFISIAASVQKDRLYFTDISIPLEPNDRIFRALPNGVREEYLVTDPGYIGGQMGLPAHYQSRIRRVTIVASVEPPRKLCKILFLAANPLTTDPLDLEEELRNLEFELRAVRFRDSISLVARHAVRPDDLVRYLRAEEPTIVHFSGHGSQDGIALRDDAGGHIHIEPTALQRVFRDRGIRLAVLNACFSGSQATSLLSSVEAVVGTSATLDDEAARRFGAAFYRTLGEGHSVRAAFRDGGDAVALHGLPDVFQSVGNLDLQLVP